MLISVGHRNFVQAELVKSILPPGRPGARDSKRAAEETGGLVDATSGRRTRSVIVLKNGHVVLSALEPSVIERRMGIFAQNLKKDEQHPQLSLFDSAEKSPVGGL